MNRRLICALVLIGLIGLWQRADSYRTRHPDNDELYQLQQIKRDMGISRVLGREESYGDHTSFPGEFIFYWLVLKVMGVERVELTSLGNMKWEVGGVEVEWFWKVAMVKGLVCLLGLVLMGVICYGFGWAGVVGMSVYSFNPHLVYHALEMRPYSVLPVLAVLNYWLSCKDKYFGLHFVVVVFTCVCHAYGPMIALLPLFFGEKRARWFWLSVPTGLILWAYYASYSMFGVTPNTAQAVVSPYEYFKPGMTAYLQSFLGSGWMYAGLAPLLLLGVIKGKFEGKFLWLFVLLPLILIAAVDIKTSYWIHPRQWVWVVPYFGLWSSGVVAWLKN